MGLSFFDIRQGRLGRLDYFLLNLLLGAFGMGVFFGLGTFHILNMGIALPVYLIFFYFTIVFQIRRLRDVGISVYWCVLGILPILPFLLFTTADLEQVEKIFSVLSTPYTITVLMIVNIVLTVYSMFLLFAKSKKEEF